MSNKESYEFEIGSEGLDYDILDKSYNENTQQFLLNNGLKEGMHVLDIGCGAGVMTSWIAKQVGPSGSVLAIDNSPEQLQVTNKNLEKLNINNVKTQVLSAYDVVKLDKKFDAIYCRFLLHHLHSPRLAIKCFYEALKPEGIYFGQEGMIHAAFSYPDSFAWRGYLPTMIDTDKEKDGEGRDGDFGMKLLYNCIESGFFIQDCSYHQPLLWKKEQKEGLISGLLAYKQTELEQGLNENEWQKKYNEIIRLINDNKQLIGFYGSCLIAAHKTSGI